MLCVPRWTITFLMFVLTAFALPVSAELPGPSQNIRSAIDQVKLIVTSERTKLTDEALDAKLKVIIEPMFNFEEMSQRSLGAYWGKASPEEQKEFVQLFSDLLARTYLKRIKRNAEDSQIIQLNENVEGDKATVRSVVRSAGEDVKVDYRLIHEKTGWRIYDVIIENVGLVSNYRNEFPAIVRKDGFAGLIKRLREKVADNAASDAAAKQH